MDGEIDFTRYSLRELREAHSSIDRQRFPINALRISEELARRDLKVEAQLPDPSLKAKRNQPSLVPIGTGSISVTLVNFDAISRRDQWQVFWGFVWRSLIVSAGSFATGFLIAVIIGILLALFRRVVGLEAQDVKVAQTVISLIVAAGVGWYLTWHLIRWLLRSRFGRYRLVLAREEHGDAV